MSFNSKIKYCGYCGWRNNNLTETQNQKPNHPNKLVSNIDSYLGPFRNVLPPLFRMFIVYFIYFLFIIILMFIIFQVFQ